MADELKTAEPRALTDQEVQQVSLTGKLTVQSDHAQIDYVLTNHSPLPIHVWDLLSRNGDDGPAIDDDLAYVCLQEPASIRVTRALLRLPTEFQVGKRSEPYVRTIEPGKSASGHVRLNLPVQEYNPYYTRNMDFVFRDCERIILLIGWIEHQAEMKLGPRNVSGRPALALGGTWPKPHQRFARLDFPCDLELKVFTEKFDRRLPLD